MKAPPAIFVWAVLAGLAPAANAAVSVGPSGYTNGFSSLASVTNNPPTGWWSKSVLGGDNNSIAATNELDGSVQTNSAALIHSGLGASAAVPPNANGLARWNSANQNVQTRPTGNMYTLLMAELQNDSGGDANAVMVSYDFGVVTNADVIEEILGHRAYFSTNGAAGSWQLAPALCLSNATTVTAILRLGAWPQGGRICLLWADDNGSSGDHTYTIDNIRFVATNAAPPVDITLHSASVRDRQPSFAMVGILKAVDPDKNDQHLYSLVAGPGDDDNIYFQIVNDTLRTSAMLDYTNRNRFSIRVRAVDALGQSCEKAFTITVLPPSFTTGFLNYFAANPAVSNASLAAFDRETSDYFWVYQNELTSTRSIDMPVPASTPADTDTNGTSSVFLTLKETMRIWAAKTAHALWLDKEVLVPWRLRDYDTNHLRGLFAKTNLFNPSGSFYFFSVVDHSPTVGYRYAVEHGLIRSNVLQTLRAVMDDGRSDFLHGSSSLGDPGCAYTLRYALTNYSSLRWRPARITRLGCHSATRILLGVLRSLNIPGYETATGEYFLAGHSQAVFPCVGLALPHGDHLYSASLTATPVEELMPTFQFFQDNLYTPPCAGDPYRVAQRHEALVGTVYPSPTMLGGVRNPAYYGYTNAVEFLSRYAGWDRGLTAAELDQAATTLLTQFDETRRLTLAVNSTQGYVIDAPSALDYTRNSRVSLKALAKPGYVFNRWTGNVTAGMETANPLVFTMDANKTIQAVFTRPPVAISMARSVAGEALIWFTAEANLAYTVQHRDDLDAGSWQTLVEVAPRPFTGVVTNSDPSMSTQARRFYRVVTGGQ